MKKIAAFVFMFLCFYVNVCCADIFLGVPERPRREEGMMPDRAWQKRLGDMKRIYLRGDYKECVDELEHLLSLRPPDAIKPGLRYLLGLALAQDGRYEDARGNYNIIFS